MKAYTDLEQSKKLAKILPLESADMYYPWYIEDDGDTIESGHRITTPNIGNFITHKANKMILPCWSLAALLSVISEVSLNTFKDKKWNVMIKHDGKMIYADKDNPVDACVELIEKLHKLKLL